MKEQTFKIICPFCSEPWSEAMIELETYATGYCETCAGHGARVEIYCGSCKKLVYQKDDG